jgi:hypothetical protein
MSNGSKSMDLNRGKIVRSYIIALAIFTLALIVMKEPAKALATSAGTGTQVSAAVNYLDEILTVNKGPGNSDRFYISLDKGKTWENIPLSGTGGQIDITAMLSSKEVIVFLRGNKDTRTLEYPLKAEPNDLKVYYEVLNGEGRITYAVSGAAVEYRKGSNGTWRSALNSMPTSIYEVKGATLYYRTAATADSRAGKVITVKVPKRPSSPAVKLDGGKLVFSGIKANETQYSLNGSGVWNYMTTDPKVKNTSLYTILNLSPSANSPLPAMMLEIRTLGNTKKPTSGVRLLEIPQQPVCPDTIKLEGTTLTITDPLKSSYEYTRVEGNAQLNIAAAKWTGISANKPVIIPKASVNDVIYVRLKSTTDSKTRLVTPASTYKYFPVTSITVKK